ncbi:MAG TPA: PH domain-containing protein [Candidatus Dormibacteraeota bacterium]|nr:PH domain-containing protein [Candidatus Dormibacteraeota bacterium]
MVSSKSVESQLKRLGFNHRGWGRTEVRELQNIILPDEEIYECVNGIYEGGFAMLLATDVRVLLVDKKPLNYLTVEDLRFDMINEIDYNHRLVGAYIRISAGETELKFTSINQPRLRKLIGHVQQCMAVSKKKQSTHQEGQHQHLEQINQQLRSYLLAQYEQQQKLYNQLQLQTIRAGGQVQPDLQPQLPEPVRPSPELADYLFAQSLLAQNGMVPPAGPPTGTSLPAIEPAPAISRPTRDQLAELYSDGLQEVFGKDKKDEPSSSEIHPFHIAYSKLPMAMRNRRLKLGLAHPSFRIPRVPVPGQTTPTAAPPAEPF